jgi:nitrite reductase/ring-hydroxylating ferredoxin subunit
MAERGEHLSRRAVLAAAIPGGAAVLGLAGGAAAMLLRPPPRDPGRTVRVCRLGEMDVGGQVLLPGVLVMRDSIGLSAISMQCTHLGCGLVRHQSGFACHCHGSLFSEAGAALRGPATDPLPWYAVLVSGGWVLVDLDRTVPAGTKTVV